MSDTTQRADAGSVVTARPWHNGRELDARRGIVLVAEWGTPVEYALVWFPEYGEPVAPLAVQAILLVKIARNGKVRTLLDEPASWVRKAHQTAKRANRAGKWLPGWGAAGFALEGARAARPDKRKAPGTHKPLPRTL